MLVPPILGNPKWNPQDLLALVLLAVGSAFLTEVGDISVAKPTLEL